jgi:hypothetical protein
VEAGAVADCLLTRCAWHLKCEWGRNVGTSRRLVKEELTYDHGCRARFALVAFVALRAGRKLAGPEVDRPSEPFKTLPLVTASPRSFGFVTAPLRS